MRIEKFYLLLGQICRYGLASLLGAVLILGILGVSPSIASPRNSNAPTLQGPSNVAQLTNTRHSTSFVTAAVNRVGAAVVRIDIERTVTRRIDPFFDDPFFRRFFGEDYMQRSPQQELLRGQGSGFIIDKSGIILTNAHVVDQADKVTVTLKDGRTFEGQVRGADEITDLAVVKIDTSSDLPVVTLGDSAQVQVGDWAIAVGNPLGLDNTVTLGIVSTLHRSSTEVGIPDKRLDFIQTDAAINPGNSGGPLLNEDGEVIGINTAIRAGATGIGFAIPIDKAKDIALALARGIHIAHPYLGIQMLTLTPELAKENNKDPNSPITVPEIQGVLIVKVLPNSPAAASGIKKGDTVVEIDNTPITTATALQNIVESSRVGKVLTLCVWRAGEIKQIQVKTGEMEEGARK